MDRNVRIFSQFACFIFAVLSADAAYDPDEVINLPGIPAGAPPFKQYSGYLNATGDKEFHYWFVESQTSPATDPLVLWLSGGPGCSSLDGYLSETGPFHVNNDGATLYLNKFSWNNQANVIYLESPAGVGFSYSPSGDIKTDDDKTAADNYLALQNFFVKFPEYLNNNFYIVGESYGGIYVPTLALKIQTGGTPIKLQGFGIGNGLLNITTNMNSVVSYAYYHSLIDSDLWTNLQTYCCQNGVCNFFNSTNQRCQDYFDEVYAIIADSGINKYALYRDCAGGIPTQMERYKIDLMTALHMKYSSTQKLHYQKIQGHSAFASTHFSSHGFHKSLEDDSVPCIDAKAETTYLNRADVRKALHIPSTVQSWTICSDAVHGNYTLQYQSMKPQILSLLPQYRALIYNGDTDLVCNFLGDQMFVRDLQMQELGPWRAWMVNGQVAGFVNEFQNVTFATVRGAGHFVPQWKPAQASYMIMQFLNNLPL